MENESAFVAPEGVYSVTDEHKPNPAQLAAVSAGPCLYPTRVTNIVVKFVNSKQGASQGFANLLGGGKDVKKDKAAKEKDDGVSLSSSDTPDEADGALGQSTSAQEHPASPAPLEPNTIFSSAPVANGKKKSVARPKHNIRTTSSTFITRIQSSEGLTKTLASKQGDVTFLFYNSAKAFSWVEAGSKAKEPLIRVTFSQHPTCHDVNTATASPERLDVIIGFATGDLVWFDPITSRYARLNKGGCISSSPCTAVRWVPASATLFIVSHADGTIVVYDKEREDGVFTPQDPSAPAPDGSSGSEDGSSHREWDPMDNIFVTMPPWHPVTSGATAPTPGKGEKEKTAKNPVSHWRVSRRSVVDFVFSPDVKFVAAISEDGCLRVIDALQEQLVDCYSSYFGALSCVAWSPDGRFILTGGQDDLLTIFSPWEQRVVARCQGHSSFISAVAFDDLRSDGRTYRFGSVGEDNKLILWDFSSGALHRPKLQASHHHRMSMSSSLSLAHKRDQSAHNLSGMSSSGFDLDVSPRYHPAPSRNEVSVVQPVLVKQLEGDLPSVLQFLPKYMLTSTKNGYIKLWIRPLALRPRPKSSKSQPLPDISDLS
ncbi:catabolite repression protein creC [Ephemerocybe angulata]|uniref:Catabolite repression protein creC n=1 Tax=Ephemerocybe angulata TaxID=980116 RepID=A0A8H6IGG6_9AGAR|nr:catabolite repression protein creC [Tulosesus angulatus]